jgi:O-antigen/teichoic acid export membrane protein
MDFLREAKKLRQQSLFRNASLLIMSTAIMSVLGFGFWLFVAHLYSPEQVGVASALISISTLLSSLSMFGLDSGLIRFLPGSKNQSRDINTALLTVGGLAALAAVAYLTIAQIFDLDIADAFLWGGGWLLFTLIIVVATLNSLTDAVFIANRKAEYHTIVYAVFGLVKLLLPIGLVGLGWLGIFAAYAVAALVALVLSFYYMVRVAGYRVSSPPDWGLIQSARKYSFNNYVGTLLAGIPAQLMPLIIIQRLGAAQAAYFAMSVTMANLLYVAPSSVAQSLLAESAHQPGQRAQHVRRAIKMLALILIPAVFLAIVIAPYLLGIFGPQYARGSTLLFQVLALGTFFVAVSSVCNTVLNVEHRSGGIVLARVALLAATFVLTFALLPLGLLGIGIAMTGGYAASNIVYIFLFKNKPKADNSAPVTSSETTRL